MASFSKKDCESIKHIIPLYVKGNLSEEQKAEVEKAVLECPDLKKEIEEWERVNKAFERMEASSPSPSKNAYSKIIARIREQEKEGFFERLRRSITAFLSSPVLSASVIAVQFFIIIFLGIYVMNQQDRVKTLSSSQAIQGKFVSVNVVFKESASEADIRKLLLRINAKIINGPHSSGLYVIGIPVEENLDDSLKKLKESGIVIFSERSY